MNHRKKIEYQNFVTICDMTNLFVSNIPFSLTPEEFKNAFSQFGEVTDARIISRTFRGRKISRGIGFIDLAKPGLLETVVAANLEIGGRKVRVFQAKPRVVVVDNIYFGNVPAATTPDEIKTLFAAYHPVDCKIVHFNTAEKVGFGFIKVSSQADRDAAIQALHNSQFKGVSLIVREAHRAFFTGRDPRSRYTFGRRRAPRGNSPAPPAAPDSQ